MEDRRTHALSRPRSKTNARLRVLYAASSTESTAGAEVRIGNVGVVAGASPECDLVIEGDRSVSGRHARVSPAEHGFSVEDLRSKNGTFMDGVAITRATVPLGAMLRLGRTVVQIVPGEGAFGVEPSEADGFGELVGSSLAMRRAYALLERAASSSASLLILGESGTGKELAARAVHAASPRVHQPFVVFDCGAANEQLVASDLFGHERGAFTGAREARAGAFVQASGGTLFLDEIGDLPLELQPKLLRMLERGEVTPLGSSRPQRHDVRIIAATHRDLEAMVGRGTFRGDLYYRLAVLQVGMPPLRRRQEDLPALLTSLLARSGSSARPQPGRNLERLSAYVWPGNVRELRNVVARAVALAPPSAPFDELPILLDGASADEVATPTTVTADRPYGEAKAELIERLERAYFTDLLQRYPDNLAQAARAAGIQRRYLYTMLDKLGLR